MKRFMSIWLVMVLVASLVGGASAMAEGLEIELDGQALDETPQAVEIDPALDLELGQIEAIQLEEVNEPEQAMNNALVSNAVVVKKLIAYELVGDEVTVISADKNITEAVIPTTVKGYPVTRIADGAFANCKKLWTVTIPETVTDIGERAFSDCRKLVFVTMDDNVSEIGAGAFRNCISISHLELPESLTEINEGTFENCQMLWKLEIPSDVTTIAKGAFYRCASLKQFTLPDALTNIGDSAFELCESMRKISIPAGVKTLGDYVFKDCTDLRQATILGPLTVIGTGAFQNCDSLRSIKLPASLEAIEKFAFAFCADLKTLTIPAAVKSVDYGAFFHCDQLEEIAMKSGVEELGDYSFAQCKRLKKADIPQSVTKIGENVFSVGSSAYIDDGGDVLLAEPLKTPKKLKLYGRPDSATEAYAKEYGIPFVIQKILPKSISIEEGKSLTLYVGHKLLLTPVLDPINAETKLKWKSNSSSVSVNADGVLTPKHAGKATVTVSTENGKKAKVTVKVIDAKSVTIDEGKNVTMAVGETLQLHATVLPEKVDTTLTWKSGSTKYATVSKTGLVKAKKKGLVTISVKTPNDKKATIKINVTD